MIRNSIEEKKDREDVYENSSAERRKVSEQR
jgi:hypothetical protein